MTTRGLPHWVTSFVGRVEEKAELHKLVAISHVVTLVGAGGSGKTRLAVELARECGEAFADGVCYVDLAPLSDPALVGHQVAQALSVSDSSSDDLSHSLVAALKDRNLLLILDNCEHLVGTACEIVSTLLAGCGNLAVIATSREPLGIDGEITFWVAPLPLPRSDVPEEIADSDAVTLFLDRAKRVRPDLRLHEEGVRAIGEICRRLDGIPLAIELAAARTRILSPSQIAQGVEERFHLLTRGARTALPRQRTLEASVEWSYSLLTDAEKVLFARLSVFPGTFDLKSVEGVCANGDPSVLDRLSALADKSLVQTDHDPRTSRYRMLETIRYYARQRLAEAGELEEIGNRHLEYFISLAQRVEPELRGRRSQRAFEILDTELDNIRTAMDWAAARKQHDRLLHLVGSIWRFWWLRGSEKEIEENLHEALAQPSNDRLARAKGLTAALAIAFYRGDFTGAVSRGEEAVSAWLELEAPVEAAWAYSWLAWARLWLAPLSARGDFDRGLDLTRKAELPGLEDTFLYGRGFQKALTGDPSQGMVDIDQALRAARTRDDDVAYSHASYFRGETLLLIGEAGKAEAAFQEALARSRRKGDAMFTANALGGLWEVAFVRRNADVANSFLEDLQELAASTGNRLQVEINRWRQARSALFLERVVSEIELERGLEALRRTGVSWVIADGLCVLAAAYLAIGLPDEARAHLEEARAFARRTGIPSVEGNAILGLARVERVLGNADTGEALAHEALRMFERAEHAPGIAEVLEVLGQLAGDQSSFIEALRLLGAADRARTAMGIARPPLHEDDLEVTRKRCHGVLDATSAGAAIEEGQRMSLVEAVAYAARGRGERKRPPTGWESLTPTELEVARLVAQGLSNPEIGRRMFISTNTVKAHVSHVFAKLGISSRAQLAAEAERRSVPASRRR